MAEKIHDDQVAELLKAVRGDGSVDAKVQHVNAVKSGIKQHNVPDHLVPQVFEGLRAASASQHAVLVNAGFTALNHLLTRLSRQEPRFLTRELKTVLPLVVDKLGDQKEKFRSLASQALTTLYGVAPADVERSVRNVAMAGKNPRAKEAGMQWVLHMHLDHGLPFRGYVPTLMDLLEDADGMVREVAKSTVIGLFKNAPNAAKSDLKRQLKNFKVRPAIEQAIVKELAPSGGTRPETPAEEPPRRPNLAASMSSVSNANERPITPAPEVRAEGVEPVYVNTQRELDDAFKEMHLYFEGKETEQNWLKREESVTKLRRFIAGNVPQDFADTFLLSLKSLLDGIIKAVNSLRTSLSKEGCSLVQDMAVAFGPGMDPMVELLMQTFVKLCAATKKISSQMANTCVDTILGRVSYSNRLMQHIWGASQDKNVQPRSYATGWLKTMLKKEGHHKHQIEHTGGLDLIEKCIKKGLADANPGVREKMRGTYWTFAGIWPTRAETIMDNLDSTAQKLLKKDPSNPNSPKKGAEGPARPGLGLSKSTMSQPKPSLRETMMAQKRATAARNLPARPGSAMAHISPVRTVSGSSNASSAVSGAAAPSATTRTRPESTVSGGMSVRPMRPAKRRPDMAPRPATAGPYSMRGNDQPGGEAPSPETLKSKAPAPRPNKAEASPRRAPARPRPGHASHASESSIPSPNAKSSVSRPAAAASPRISPARLRQSQTSLPTSSPTRGNESLTLMVPTTDGVSRSSPAPEAVAPPPQGTEAVEEQEMANSKPEIKREVVLTTTGPHAQLVEAEFVESEAAAVSEPLTETYDQTKPAEESVRESEQGLVASPPTTTISVTSPSKDASTTPNKTLQVFEDPFVGESQGTPKPISPAPPVLADKPVNENAAGPQLSSQENKELTESPEKSRQNSRLLESGISRVKARSLDVHGFRKLQTLIRENRAVFTDEKFGALLTGLFEYLEAPLADLAPSKVQDVKAQVLATIKLMLSKERDGFQPHVARGLESLVATRSAYDSRAHIVSGLEILSEELVAIGDPPEMAVTMTSLLRGSKDTTVEGARSLSMGLHVLRELLDKRESYVPSEGELAQMAGLAGRCLESGESAVRMGAVQLCVALHARIGAALFWDAVKGAKDDPKNLITYYIAKRQREAADVAI